MKLGHAMCCPAKTPEILYSSYKRTIHFRLAVAHPFLETPVLIDLCY